jgi:hypothetical protein
MLGWNNTGRHRVPVKASRSDIGYRRQRPAQERSMTRSRNCPTLFTAIALASCIVSLPAAALVSQGTLPSMFERQGLPQWPDNPWIGPLDQGLPVMALRPIGLLEPLLSPAPAPPSASLARHASRTPASIAVGPRMFPSLRRIPVHRAVYARFKIPSRPAFPIADPAVFIGGLY